MFRLVLFSGLLGFGTLACSGGSSTPATNTSSNQTCESFHECVNGACECTTSGVSGTSCEEASCESTCEVCSS